MIYLMRGFPGSGKTTWWQTWQANFPDAFVCSADLEMMEGDKYIFKPEKLREAHAKCFSKYLNQCERILWLYKHFHRDYVYNKRDIIIVDNTNIKLWEISPYITLANYYNLDYKIIQIEPECPENAAKRNVHGVPFEKAMSMYETMKKEQLPPFWNVEIVKVP